MRNIDGDDRLWGDAIDRFRRICELTLWLSRNAVCNSNLARLVRSAGGLSENTEHLRSCLAEASESDEVSLYETCYLYFKVEFWKLPSMVREAAARSILDDLDFDEDLKLDLV